MIVIAEFNYRGGVHEMVNSCMVDMVRRIYPRQELCLVGEKALVDNLRELAGVRDLEVKDLYADLSKYPDPRASRLRSLWRIMRYAKKQKADYVFFLSLLPVGGACLRLIRPFFRRQKVLAVLHGELEHLRQKPGQPNYRLGRVLRFALTTRGDRTRFIVLGPSIKRNLLEVMPSLEAREIVAVDHPYPYPALPPRSLPDAPVNFVQFGVGSLSKGTQHIFDTARKVKAQSPASTFYIAGGIYPELEPWLDPQAVRYPTPGESLTRGQIDGIAAGCHYALFYYTNEHYKLCASGAFFDAVRCELPILCLRNDFFEYYFEKYGPLGYLFDSLDELNAKVAELARELPKAQYEAQQANLRYMKQQLDINGIAMRLEEQITYF